MENIDEGTEVAQAHASTRTHTRRPNQGRKAARRAQNKVAFANARMEQLMARAAAAGIELAPRPLNSTFKGSVKGAAIALCTDEVAWAVGLQLVQGALDSEGPRQLEYIRELKQWRDGLETNKVESTQRSARLVLSIDKQAPRGSSETSEPRYVEAQKTIDTHVSLLAPAASVSPLLASSPAVGASPTGGVMESAGLIERVLALEAGQQQILGMLQKLLDAREGG